MNRRILNIVAVIALLAAPMPAIAAERALPQDERVAEMQPSVKVDGDVIELRNPGKEPLKVEIFSITGQLVKSVVVKSSPVKVELPKGFYIVKCESWTRRVMLK